MDADNLTIAERAQLARTYPALAVLAEALADAPRERRRMPLRLITRDERGGETQRPAPSVTQRAA